MSKKADSDRDEMRPEYDFTTMKGGVRGKYAARLSAGTNLVLLEPDVAEAFPSDAAVNEALRGMLSTTKAVRRRGGLPDKTLKPKLHGSGRPRSPSGPERRRA